MNTLFCKRNLGLLLLVAWSMSCESSTLSVPYDQLYVPCEVDDDCPREAPECHTHLFYEHGSRTTVAAYRQCSRACSTVTGGCVDTRYGPREDGGRRLIAVNAFCMPEDTTGVYDRLADTGEGHCIDLGRVLGSTLPECPTQGTASTEIFTGFVYATACLPPLLDTFEAPLEPNEEGTP